MMPRNSADLGQDGSSAIGVFRTLVEIRGVTQELSRVGGLVFL